MESIGRTGACLHKEEEEQQRRLSQEEVRKLQKKRNAKRHGYREMAGEEKVKIVQKSRCRQSTVRRGEGKDYAEEQRCKKTYI
jgi:hypothetical protein